MKTIKELKRSANESASWRGHKLNRWETIVPHRKYWARCLICQKTVTVIVTPLPNEIDISGKAVALGCKENHGSD